jgi:hypothetical protein
MLTLIPITIINNTTRTRFYPLRLLLLMKLLRGGTFQRQIYGARLLLFGVSLSWVRTIRSPYKTYANRIIACRYERCYLWSDHPICRPDCCFHNIPPSLTCTSWKYTITYPIPSSHSSSSVLLSATTPQPC